jgi:hypothetical protein
MSSALFADDEFPSKSVAKRMKAGRKVAPVRNVVDHATLKPGRYRLTIDSSLRPYTSAITVDVLRVYDDNSADIKVVESRHLAKGAESNVPLSWDGGRRVFTELS